MPNGDRFLRSQHSFDYSLTAEIREDEEQAVKYQEINDLFIAAGYFRARINDIPNFDKVVGGLTWCIESLKLDTDIDLVFHENITFGQKIALTEKIVAVLLKMNCPHRIEPHQIQGLDCIHILPVVQWLIIQLIKTRDEMAEFVQAFSLSQFEKNYSDNSNLESATLKNIKSFKQDLIPFRRNKRPSDPSGESETQSKNDLVKHEDHNLDHLKVDGDKFNIESKKLAAVTDGLKNLSTLENQEEITVVALKKKKIYLQNKIDQCFKDKQKLMDEMTETNEKLEKIRSDRKMVENAFQKMRKMETDENKGYLRRIKELLSVYDGLKDQESKFRENCRNELTRFQNAIAEVENDEPLKEEQMIAYNKHKGVVSKLKLQLAKKKRQISLITRQIDDIPSRLELTQYQKRFLELYKQVSAKHKETKQHYTLFNTLDDTKLYISKELSILNSIQENYKKATLSTSKWDEFITQFNHIVAGILQNERKVHKKLNEEKTRKRELMSLYLKLKEQQRCYLIAVEQLETTCSLNRKLLLDMRVKEKNKKADATVSALKSE